METLAGEVKQARSGFTVRGLTLRAVYKKLDYAA